MAEIQAVQLNVSAALMELMSIGYDKHAANASLHLTINTQNKHNNSSCKHNLVHCLMNEIRLLTNQLQNLQKKLSFNQIQDDNSNAIKHQNYPLINSGYTVLKNQELKWMELKGTTLYLYENTTPIIDEYNNEMKLQSTINLLKYKSIKTVEPVIKKRMNSGRVLKKDIYAYGFTLDNDEYFRCKSANAVLDWVTHIQYIFSHRKPALYPTINPPIENKSSEYVMLETDQVSRVNYVLKLYDLWIKQRKYDTTAMTQNSITTESINDYMNRHNVSVPKLLDDYHYCILNKRFNKSDHTYKYFDNGYIQRNNRDRNLNNEQNAKAETMQRKRLYFGYSDPENVHLLQLLDSIHVNMNCHSSIAIHRDNFMINLDENDSDHPETAGKFAFGINFSYYKPWKSQHCVQAYYNTLNGELTKNPIYKITQKQWEDTYHKALYLMQTKAIQNIKSANIGGQCKSANICKGSAIRINHLICIMVYTNFSKLQFEFKKLFRHKYKHEGHVNLNLRHRYIYHWSRYLNELVTFYGDIMTQKQTVYVGLNSKLVLNQLINYFHCPLSTSINYGVASDFATTKGIILELKRGHEFSRCFNAFMVSDFPMEWEIFFCGSRLEIVNFKFISSSKSYKSHCKAIKLFERMLSGHLFMHKKELLTDKVMNRLMSMIDNYINDYNEEYVQQIFNNIVKMYVDNTINPHQNNPSNFAIGLHLAELYQIKHSNLCQYFYDFKNNQFGTLLQFLDAKKELLIDINKERIVFKLKDDKIIRFRETQQYISRGVAVNVGKSEFTFYIAIEPSSIDPAQYACFILLKQLDKRVTHIEIVWDLVIKEINYEIYRRTIALGANRCFFGNSIGHKDLFNKADSLTLITNIKVLRTQYLDCHCT
eukprot:417581_1